MIDKEEAWKPIKGYEGLYEISSYGNVKSLNYNREKIFKKLKSILMANGYMQVTLSKNKVKKAYRIHRLVAEHFIVNNKTKPMINHIDGDRSNNHIANLEWCTNSENQKHAIKIGLKKVNYETIKKMTNIRKKPVNQYDRQGNFIKTWESQSEAGRSLKINQHNINSCCRNKLETAGGFIWTNSKKGLI